jgi:hypothetical protein
MSEIQFYYAHDHNNNLITIDTADKKRDGPFKCPHCGREMVAKNVKMDRVRARCFAHKHLDDQTSAAQCYDHVEHLGLQESILVAFYRHVLDRTPYLVRHHCDTCTDLIEVDLTGLGKTMEREKSFERLRPDLLIRDETDQVQGIIEIVIEHALSEENAAKYLNVGVPVFVVYDSIPERLIPLAAEHDHTREIVSDWIPAAIMLNKRSHSCELPSSTSTLRLPTSGDPIHLDNCTLPPIGDVTRQDTPAPTTARSKHNPFQIPLRPPNLRTMEGGSGAVDPLFAMRLAETLHSEMPETALDQAFCPIHNVHMQGFIVDISLRRCPSCNADVRMMTLSPWYFESPEATGELNESPHWFLPPGQEKFIETVAQWGVSLIWFPWGAPTGGILMSRCPSCSDPFHWFGTWPYVEPYEFLVDRRHFYWCSVCNEYRWSGQLDDIAERLRAPSDR